uniref:Homeobox domain-containing protein n=1 Tax=Macrostomum lignano TaxID=282301 RepID=A0A1I8FA54_9PLAT
LGVCTASAEQHNKEIDASHPLAGDWNGSLGKEWAKGGFHCSGLRALPAVKVVSAMSSAQEQEGSKRRSRLDEFLANNSGLVASSPAVTHVLCCPAMPSCCFMSLQESELVAHPLAVCVGPADSCNVTVYSCSRCHGASTQLDLMRQHMNIYHGLSGQEEVSSQLTACQLSCRPVDFGGPAPTGSRKRKSHVPPLLPARKFRSFWDSSAAKPGARPCIPPAVSPASASDILDLRLKPPADAADAEDALLSQPQQLYPQSSADCSIPPASSSTNSPSSASSKSACGILDLSLKRLADAASPMSQKPQQQQQQARHPKQQQQKTIAKPQRQNFTDVQNSQLQGWFSEHRQKPYPQHADTHRLAELTGLSYPQVKKWFANRRMRTKTPCELLPEMRSAGSGLSSGKASPSNWSLANSAQRTRQPKRQ